MWLLHGGNVDVRVWSSEKDQSPKRGTDQKSHLGKSVPLHGLSQHRRGHQRDGGQLWRISWIFHRATAEEQASPSAAMGLCLEQAYKRKYGANCGTKATG